MQQVLSHNHQRAFFTELNALLMEGWTVVPGTMYVTSFSYLPPVGDFAVRRLSDGSSVRQIFTVVVYRDDVC